MTPITRIVLLLGLVLVLGGRLFSPAQAATDLAPLVAALGQGGYDQTEQAVNAITATGDSRAAPVIQALGDGDLYARKSDKSVVIARRKGSDLALTDPITGADLGTAKSSELEKVRVNNKLRRVVRSAIGTLTLMSPDRNTRLSAANAVFQARDADALEILDTAIAKETDAQVRDAMENARAAAILNSQHPEAEKIEAVQRIAALGNDDALKVLNAVQSSAQGDLRTAAAKAIAGIQRDLAFWNAGQNVLYGLSLGSVLLLAAIGLAITFGVMGVINMAHGEMVMLGAYTTYVVQEAIRTSAPGLFDYSLAIALPLAFIVAGAIGLVIERTIIRWLYGRPLETLLATWGLSLILQQAVRSIFGPNNRQVGAPAWMSGAFDVDHLTITYSRLWILVFALAVFVLLNVLLRATSFGLQMRAVTQNRRMAASMGIRTPWVDAFTFALGSGVAGIAGVALSQIDNVSPNLGQSYIIDSFMVVVFGGVGNLWGTLVGALSLGVLNKFLEPYAGAVLAKILVLVLIILFIQKRPRGLFALKGRAVEQ
ncbi:amino acid/amide ABC transporter membrane protein 1, HAAT family [Faunimonas pinastri]|uniref:Amino acid/amide ABC transporter membrane protein 1, HAAT family n=1 Tax=Faunimonas pinastri TaxID=1855383 RepID=A0A1H9NAF7_9HYPH|nr:urea ABC transporter permease subunit UrtB [Faunimonas pinastri]SER32791.1 amino acid/amide ABC transporter membrane protein 1, HAAT family [Faunimonas pinastri]